MADKSITFLGTSREAISRFPEDAKTRAGYQLWRVQQGHEPDDWKPMSSVGPGVQEIRIDVGDAYRVIYIAKYSESVYVLHAFRKMTRQTSQRDIDLARRRLKEIEAERTSQKRREKR